jgi:hypothetical protein
VVDPGLPTEGGYALMNGITDKAGNVISEDPEVIAKTLLEYWAKVFQSSDKLSDKCVSNVAASMESLRHVCDELRRKCASLDKDVPVVLAAADPLQCVHGDALRERVAAAATEQAAKDAGAVSVRRGAEVKRSHEAHWARLQARFDDDELMWILPFVKDTGTGVDGGPLEMLRFARDETRAAMLVLLNRVPRVGQCTAHVGHWTTDHVLQGQEGVPVRDWQLPTAGYGRHDG